MRASRRFPIFKIVILLLLVAGLLLALFTTVDTSSYQVNSFYHRTLARIDSLRQPLMTQASHDQLELNLGANATRHGGVRPGKELSDSVSTVGFPQNSLLAGWHKESITPHHPVRLTGKNFTPYEKVYDSVYVRTFLFDHHDTRVALINYDLWIMHPKLAGAVRKMVDSEFPEVTGIYFTANHSHTSIGGWASGLLGHLVVGGNNEQTVEFIVDQTRQSIKEATGKLQPVKVGYSGVEARDLVMNRLDENGYVDQELRMLALETSTGKQAVFNTFSAHSVYMDKDINTLSADYPGGFLNYLEAGPSIDFAAFAPGATGSHTPVGRKPFEFEKMSGYSRKLARYSNSGLEQLDPAYTNMLKYAELPVDLRSPHFRISNHLRFRPWVFNRVMNPGNPKITILRIGKTVLIGLPVELSGEYYPEFDAICQERDLNLMITSFNGWYLGYVNPKKYYFSLKRAETRDMNWFGPENGEYFVELIKKILEIV